MRGLICILLLALFAFSSLLMITSNTLFFNLIGLAILPITLSVYFDKRKISLTILIISCILSGSSVFLGAQPLLVLTMVLIFISFYLILNKNKNTFLRLEEKHRKEINENKKRYEDFLKETEKIEFFNQEISRQTEEIENLYKITKRMSAYLQFDEIFKILCSELKNAFEFDDCRLINISNIKGIIEIDDVYSVITEGKMKNSKPYDKKIVEMLYQEKKTLSIISKEDNKLVSEFDLPSKIKTLLALPLVVKNEIKSIIVVENIKAENFEKFSIVIGQFALEIRKVKLYEIVQKLAIEDSLTNLLLKKHFLESLEKELKYVDSHNLKISILMVDIDHFKRFNDNYGHLMGDRVLIKISEIIKNNTREFDLVSRYGGEEFVLALPETDKKKALDIAERIRKQIENEKFISEEGVTKATISIGIACFPEDSRRVIKLIDMSDQALYEAKRSGRNNTCLYKSIGERR